MSAVTLDNKTILVTGAAGFIGSNLVKRRDRFKFCVNVKN